VLYAEYGEREISSLSTPLLSVNNIRRANRLLIQDKKKAADIRDIRNISLKWPHVIPDDIVFQCLSNYQKHTVWIPPSICCVCGLQSKTVIEVDVSNKSDCIRFFLSSC
jgi:hypothetical protein